MNKVSTYLIAGGLFILVTGWLGWQEVKVHGADWLPVKHVRIEGAFQYLAKNTIKEALHDQLLDGFYNVDVQEVQASVRDLPWVDAVLVKRVWPDAINIKIKEQVPVVRWGDSTLLNNKGERFEISRKQDFSFLPILIGPDGFEAKMLEALEGISLDLANEGMKLAEFKVNERRAWSIKLQNKMLLNAGKNQPLEKIQRFLKTVYLLGEEQIAEIAIVDLRYSNGYALTWKQGEAEIDWTKIAEMNKT